jgi:FkbM family methyltransferase
MLKGAKDIAERISGCRIYRNSLPHGVDCFLDIGRQLGRNGIKVVFDVGANIGQSAIDYLHRCPQAEIYSFEPVAATYKELVAATHQFPRVHSFNFGMGRETGEVVINVNPLRQMSSIKVRRPEDHPETIRLDTIANFVEEHRIEVIDFLKVDTEGYDLDVLSGAAPLLRQQRIHFVQAECEPVVCTKAFVGFPTLVEFMQDFGYRLFGVYEQQPNWDYTNVLLYWNTLFICEKLVSEDSRLPCLT